MGIRSIFDGLYVDQLFHKDDLGQTVFYPFGRLGRGYLLPPDREAAMRRSMRLLMLVSIVVGMSFGTLLLNATGPERGITPAGWLVLGAIFVLLMGGIVYVQSRLAKGLEASSVRLSAGAWFKRGREARAPWTYLTSVILGVLLLLMGGAGIALGFQDGDGLMVASAVFLFAGGALLTWDGTMGLIERGRRLTQSQR